MIAPRYMICSEGKIVDQETGLISYINVIERLLIGHSQGHPRQVSPAFRFFVSAVWATDEETPVESECEWEMLVSFPGEKEPKEMGSGGLQFTRPFYRIDVLFQIASGDSSRAQIKLESGVIRFTSRIRRKGDIEWLSQEYTIPLDVVSAPQSNVAEAEKVESS